MKEKIFSIDSLFFSDDEPDRRSDAVEPDVDTDFPADHYDRCFYNGVALYGDEAGKRKRWVRDKELLEVLPPELLAGNRDISDSGCNGSRNRLCGLVLDAAGWKCGSDSGGRVCYIAGDLVD